MARPCKSAKVLTDCSQTKEEIDARAEYENKMRGQDDGLEPPKFLTRSQRRIFRVIRNHLKDSGILGNLDVYILSQCAIAIDRIRYIEEQINRSPAMLLNKALMSSKDKYTKDFFRCCNELSLSPQSRAKIANINLQSGQNREDPLLQALAGEEDEEDE